VELWGEAKGGRVAMVSGPRWTRNQPPTRTKDVKLQKREIIGLYMGPKHALTESLRQSCGRHAKPHKQEITVS